LDHSETSSCPESEQARVVQYFLDNLREFALTSLGSDLEDSNRIKGKSGCDTSHSTRKDLLSQVLQLHHHRIALHISLPAGSLTHATIAVMFPLETMERTIMKGMMQREEKLFQFKKQLAWKLCSDLLSPPIPSVSSFRHNREDTEEERALRRKDYEDQIAQVEQERKVREPELMDKLDEVIERVRNSRHEKLADNEEVWQTITGSEIERPRFICGSCGNENHTFFITDPHTGDTICLGKNNMGCGNVVQDHYVDEGQQYRKFADDTVFLSFSETLI
jgi:hypothetical protein